jgi:hypothetical protein
MAGRPRSISGLRGISPLTAHTPHTAGPRNLNLTRTAGSLVVVAPGAPPAPASPRQPSRGVSLVTHTPDSKLSESRTQSMENWERKCIKMGRCALEIKSFYPLSLRNAPLPPDSLLFSTISLHSTIWQKEDIRVERWRKLPAPLRRAQILSRMPSPLLMTTANPAWRWLILTQSTGSRFERFGNTTRL